MRAPRARPRFSRPVAAAAADGTAGHAVTRARYRAKYDETIWDVKKKVEKSTGTPAEKLQIFHHKKELLDEEYKDKTLDEMNLHTGFSLLAYDLVRRTPARRPPGPAPTAGVTIFRPVVCLGAPPRLLLRACLPERRRTVADGESVARLTTARSRSRQTVPPKYFPAVKRMPNGALRQCTPNFPEAGDDTDGHSEGYCP